MKVVNTILERHNLPVKIWMSPSSKKILELVTGRPAKVIEMCSTLGLQWNLCTDYWSWDKEKCLNLGPSKCGIKKAEFDLKDHNQVEGHLRKYGLTRRTYLKVYKSLFDPMGLLTPISQSFNLLFQEIIMGHSCNHEWDTKLDAEYIMPF